MAKADEIIAQLGLMPHPEGGFFRETFRDEAEIAGRSCSTLIYFLLRAGERSHWHTVDAVETWHFYAGAPLNLHLADPDGSKARTMVLGVDLAAGQKPQAVVPKGHWQAAETLGDYTLVGCTVAPGFTFDGFVLAPKGWSPHA